MHNYSLIASLELSKVFNEQIGLIECSPSFLTKIAFDSQEFVVWHLGKLFQSSKLSTFSPPLLMRHGLSYSLY